MERFDITAKAESSNPTKDDMRRMMQSLLVERFSLRLHTEEVVRPVLTLTTVKPRLTGPWLQQHPTDKPCVASALGTGSADVPVFQIVRTGGFPKSCGGIAESLTPSRTGCVRTGGRNVSLRLLADTLPELSRLRLPVVDATNLSGNYDFILEWAPESDTGEQRCDIPLQSALHDQLGLQLRKQKHVVRTYVVDHIEHPSPN